MTTILAWVLMTYNSYGIVYSPFVATKEDCQRMAASRPASGGYKECVKVAIPYPVELVSKPIVKKVR